VELLGGASGAYATGSARRCGVQLSSAHQTKWRRSSEALGLTIRAIRGAIFLSLWVPLARLMASLDQFLGQATTFGASFVASQVARA
jgi:hypothetical protein